MATDYRMRLVDLYADELLEQLAAVLVIGPRACGKTTTFSRRAATVVRLDREAEAAPFEADADIALKGLEEPVLLDEWHNVPSVLGAVRRSVDDGSGADRYYVSGSVRGESENLDKIWPGTGRLIRLTMYPMSVRERIGNVGGPTFFDKLAEGGELEVPRSTPDLLGYLELALQSGYPDPALELDGASRQAWLESYLDDLLTYDIEQVEELKTRPRDRERLRRYFEAYALNSAGLTNHKRIYDAAGITKKTAADYETLFSDLLVVEQVQAWTTNRIKRLSKTPKRYVIDPALVAAALRLDEQGIMRGGDLLGRTLDGFVAAQLRPELKISRSRPRLFHLRQEDGRREVDLVAELAGERIIGIETKASSKATTHDARHLAWMRDELGDRFVRGLVFHTGPQAFELEEKIIAAPISALWG
jgi:predicted AAA+ superfamily ATPase